MRFEPRLSRLVAALIYAIAAVLAAVSLFVVLSNVAGFDAINRDALLFEIRPLLLIWGAVCCAGVIFAVVSLRFAALSTAGRRAMFAASVVVAVFAGGWLEWWQSLYFVLPALLLLVAHRRRPHRSQ